mgnify:CR=1 FL=1
MHIVFVVAFFAENEYSRIAGMPRYVAKISKLLSERGHTIEIAAGADNSRKWLYHNILVHNCQWYGTLQGSSFEITKSIWRREKAIQKVLREIDDRQKIDIVQYAGWSGVGFMHNLRCPSVLRLSTYSKIQYSSSELFGKYTKVYSHWERKAGKRADEIIGPSNVLLNSFTKDVHKKGKVFETPYQLPDKEDCSLYYEQLKGKKYFLFYGTASYDKGIETISNMLPYLFEFDKEIYMVIAGWDVKKGNSSTIKQLKDKQGDNSSRVISLGVVSQEKLFPIIRNAEAVIVPSIIDNLPNSGVEALCLDKILIGTFGTSLEQLIEDGKNGFLSIPGDPISLFKCVENVLNLTDLQKEAFRNNNENIKIKFSPEVAVGKLEDFYMSLLGG